MSYRGRLIFPMLAEIYPLDTFGTASNSGYDNIYREAKKVASVDQLGTSARQEAGALLVPSQFEPAAFGRLQMLMTGDAATARFVLVMHFADLEEQGLVDSSTGIALIRKGARLGGVRKFDGTLVQAVPKPPGMYVTEAMPIFGIGGERSLLQVTFESADPGK